jgi:signal peptidase I
MSLLDRTTSRVPRPWRSVLDWALTIAVAAGFVLVFEAEIAKPYRIPSSSMEPTLRCAKPGEWCSAHSSDRVIANRLAYRFSSPQRGQIVVFKAPASAAQCGGGDGGTTFVKRLIGLPGDKITERNGAIFVNGTRLAEPYVERALRGDESGTWPRVAAGRYFFLGDDRVHSCDSRIWGTVPRGNLVGPVLLTYWPPDRISVR